MDTHTRSVRQMFTSIAQRYDLLNHLLSLNLDRRWRRAAARVALDGRPQPLVLDLCAGTGDLALELVRQYRNANLKSELSTPKPETRNPKPESQNSKRETGLIVALDFVEPMLERARAKSRRKGMAERIRVVCGHAFHLPFPDHSFDLVTVAFGLRNIAPVEGALGEAARVLRPGGRFVALEFALPARGLWRQLYGFYFFHILPKIGRWMSGTSAYSYLPASVALFPEPARFCETLGELGFAGARWQPLTGGVVALYTASAPSPAEQASCLSAGVARTSCQ